MFRNSSVNDCIVMPLSKINNRSGNITITESEKNIPFSIKRIYYLYDIPSGEVRGGHGHKELFQIIVAASGSFDVKLDDGINNKIVSLNRPDYGLLVVPGIWRDLLDFSSGSICLVIASLKYDQNDYIHNYEDYLSYKKKLKK